MSENAIYFLRDHNSKLENKCSKDEELGVFDMCMRLKSPKSKADRSEKIESLIDDINESRIISGSW